MSSYGMPAGYDAWKLRGPDEGDGDPEEDFWNAADEACDAMEDDDR